MRIELFILRVEPNTNNRDDLEKFMDETIRKFKSDDRVRKWFRTGLEGKYYHLYFLFTDRPDRENFKKGKVITEFLNVKKTDKNKEGLWEDWRASEQTIVNWV